MEASGEGEMNTKERRKKKVGQLLSEIIFPTPKMVGFNFKLGP